MQVGVSGGGLCSEGVCFWCEGWCLLSQAEVFSGALLPSDRYLCGSACVCVHSEDVSQATVKSFPSLPFLSSLSYFFFLISSFPSFLSLLPPPPCSSSFSVVLPTSLFFLLIYEYSCDLKEKANVDASMSGDRCVIHLARSSSSRFILPPSLPPFRAVYEVFYPEHYIKCKLDGEKKIQLFP